jgi:hypothetical protein
VPATPLNNAFGMNANTSFPPPGKLTGGDDSPGMGPAAKTWTMPSLAGATTRAGRDACAVLYAV